MWPSMKHAASIGCLSCVRICRVGLRAELERSQLNSLILARLALQIEISRHRPRDGSGTDEVAEWTRWVKNRWTARSRTNHALDSAFNSFDSHVIHGRFLIVQPDPLPQ